MTETYSGSTRTTGVGACTGDTHAFAAADGPIVLRLVSASRPLTAQICAGGVGSPDCSLTRRPIAVSETIEVTKRGAGSQVLSFLPLDCVSGQAFSPDPAIYTATVTFQR